MEFLKNTAFPRNFGLIRAINRTYFTVGFFADYRLFGQVTAGSCGVQRSLQVKICLAHPVAQGSRVDRALCALLWVRRNGVSGCSQGCEHAAATVIAVKDEQAHVGPGGVWRAVYQCHETAQGALAACLLIDGLNVLVQVGRVGIQLPRFGAPVDGAGAGLQRHDSVNRRATG